MMIRFLVKSTYHPTLNFRRDVELFGQRNLGRFVNKEISLVLSRRR